MARIRKLQLLVIAIMAIVPATSASAQLNAVAINALVNGKQQQIGSLTATLPSTAAGMNATFTMNALGSTLDNAMCTFDWFQVVTSDPSPPRVFNGTAAGGAGPNTPYVDPVFNGYQYQQTPKKGGGFTPGDDQAPYYWNAGEFPGHHVAGTSVNISDSPGQPVGNLQFATYLVARPLTYAAGSTFNIIAGFTWGYNTVAGPPTKTTITQPTAINIGNLNLANLNTAMTNAGFSTNAKTGFTITTGADLAMCLPTPEMPSGVPFGLMLIGLAAIVVVSRSRRTVGN